MKNMLEKLDEKGANISQYNKVAEKKATEINDIEKSLFEICQQLNDDDDMARILKSFSIC